MKVDLFPRHIACIAAEVTIAGYSRKNRLCKSETLNDSSGSQIYIRQDISNQFIKANFFCTESINSQRHGVCETNGVAELDFTLIGTTRSDDVFSKIPRHVSFAAAFPFLICGNRICFIDEL